MKARRRLQAVASRQDAITTRCGVYTRQSVEERTKSAFGSLQAQRETCALRDMDTLVQRLEELFWQMQGEAERGETPVPDLRNLGVYYEIGTELAAANIEFESEQAYRQRYLEQLRLIDEHAPLTPDARLWMGTAG